jgi:predicted DCC family thiol-disulfide oxidoreductase YuxK
VSADGGLILYDGVCDVCSAAVTLIRSNDPQGRFRFAPLESELGRATIAAAGRDPQAPPSLLLADACGLHAQSDAVLRIARGLRAPWPVAAAIAGAVPRSIRDAVYCWIARHRYALRR